MTDFQKRFEQEFCKMTDLLASDYSDPSEDKELAGQIFHFMETEIATALEEQKKEVVVEIIDRIEMWADDGVIRTTEDITNRLSDLLTQKKED